MVFHYLWSILDKNTTIKLILTGNVMNMINNVPKILFERFRICKRLVEAYISFRLTVISTGEI